MVRTVQVRKFHLGSDLDGQKRRYEREVLLHQLLHRGRPSALWERSFKIDNRHRRIGCEYTSFRDDLVTLSDHRSVPRFGQFDLPFDDGAWPAGSRGTKQDHADKQDVDEIHGLRIFDSTLSAD